MSTATFYLGDVAEVLAQMEPRTFDAVLTDPPYALADMTTSKTIDLLQAWLAMQEYNTGAGFMGRKWDVMPSPAAWQAVRRVQKPGALLFAFGGTRTQDFLSLGLRLGGYEIRDCIAWMHSQGFAKGANISKKLDEEAGAEREVVGRKRFANGTYQRATARAGLYSETRGQAKQTAPATDLARDWDDYHSNLRPSHEPIIIAQNQRDGTFANNARVWGCGGLNVGGCRIERWGESTVRPLCHNAYQNGQLLGEGSGTRAKQQYSGTTTKGAFPQNTLLSCECETDDHERPGCQVRALAEQSGERPSGGQGRSLPEMKHGAWRTGHKARVVNNPRGADTGTAARFYYCAKSSPSERHKGLDDFYWVRDKRRPSGFRRIDKETWEQTPKRQRATGNIHPTVKPLEILRYIATLLLPPPRETPRRLLVPFCGSGSEVLAALQDGWDEVVGIDMVDDYLDIARARVQH